MGKNIRVRFAPSPTGSLHIGGVRTALYNYLFAKKNNGTFILRIEDTDQKRYVPGAEQYILDALRWLGLNPSEGPEQGGKEIYYRQSERNEIYAKYIAELLATGNAYYAFDTPEELEAMRQRMLSAKIPSPKYNIVSREFMRNSLRMPQEEVQGLMQSGTPYVIRLKTPHKQEIRFQDKVRGWIKVSSEELEDKVLMKSDGIPTYHFANVVDDHLMEITHVIRGEEWIPSTPMHILLYHAFGWESTMPEFVHLPLLLKPNGEGKLSKRDADQLGFPIFPLSWRDPASGEEIVGFREKGYLPEALLNFLALMGWNPGNNKEVLTMEEMVDQFSLERIGKAGARFDISKAKWLNHEHIMLMPEEDLANKVSNGLRQIAIESEPEKLRSICSLLRERASFVQEIVYEAVIFFKPPQGYDPALVSSKVTTEGFSFLEKFLENSETLEDFSEQGIKTLLHEVAESMGVKPTKVMPGLRLAITGAASGPDLVKMLSLIGKAEVQARLQDFLTKTVVDQ